MSYRKEACMTVYIFPVVVIIILCWFDLLSFSILIKMMFNLSSNVRYRWNIIFIYAICTVIFVSSLFESNITGFRSVPLSLTFTFKPPTDGDSHTVSTLLCVDSRQVFPQCSAVCQPAVIDNPSYWINTFYTLLHTRKCVSIARITTKSPHSWQLYSHESHLSSLYFQMRLTLKQTGRSHTQIPWTGSE